MSPGIPRRGHLAHALLFALALAPATACKSEAAQTQVDRDETPIPVHVAEAVGRQRPVALTLDGTLLADEESNVTSIVSGRVVGVSVERGAKVEAGAELIRLRDVDFKLQAKLARAQLDEARARLGMRQGGKLPNIESLPEVALAKSELELAESELVRTEKLATGGVLSQTELDQARTKARSAADRYQTAKNSGRGAMTALQGAQASLEQAQTSAAEAVVRAPFAGEIAARMVSLGEYVTPQIALVTLVRTDPLRIELSVPQQHLESVKPGQTVTLTVDAVADKEFNATVRYVSASVQRDTRSLTVEAVVPNPDGLLRPGLFAAARLQTGGQQTVTEVPAVAVRTAAGVSRVFVIAGDHIEERVVSVAERTSEIVTIAEGLQPGDRVAVDQLDQLGDGIAITVLDDVG
ncbi:MAG: efflux RND transporter periplasmic adaptor subunit [Deltaproteobacteria bacterium]|nr:efflux RND transporter periplasmic adaptor subunit [Nannocystaceae bacterium]